MTCNSLSIRVASDVLAFWSKANNVDLQLFARECHWFGFWRSWWQFASVNLLLREAAALWVSSVLATVSQHQQALCNQSPSLLFAVKIQSTAFTRSPTNQTIVQLSFGLAKYKTKIIRQCLNKLSITIIIDAIIVVISSL